MRKEIIILLLLVTGVALSGPNLIRSLPDGVYPEMRPRLAAVDGEDSPASNSIGDIEYNAETGDIWVSTGRGLAVSRDGGLTWEHKLTDYGFSALAVLGQWVWAAASYDAEDPTDPNNTLPAGDGFYASFDAGQTFARVDSMTDTTLKHVSKIGQLAYDIAIVPEGNDTGIYAACFYGGLLYSLDGGESWDNIFPDGATSLDYKKLRHRFFSVAADTSMEPPLVWAGSAEGLFAGRTGDSAWNWFDFNDHWIPDLDNQGQWEQDTLNSGAISGEWIISIDFLYGDSTGLFACTRATGEESGGYGYDAISFTFDSGQTWQQTGEGYIVWNMGFTGDTLWAAGTHGLSRFYPPDYSAGDTLHISGYDVNAGNYVDVLVDEVVSATCCDGKLFVGTNSEGLAFTTDGGRSWSIIAHFFEPLAASSQDPDAGLSVDYVYAFPNPYSPLQHRSCFFVLGQSVGDEDIKIELFDYDIQRLGTIFNGSINKVGKTRVQWDGTLLDGSYPVNGLYFFRVIVGSEERWGKLMIVK